MLQRWFVRCPRSFSSRAKTGLARAMREILVALVVKDRERRSNIKVHGPDMAILGGLNSWLIGE